MKIDEIPGTFSQIFTLISLYEELFNKEHLKPRVYLVPKEERELLKVVYQSFEVKRYFKFWEFFEICKKLTLLNKETLIQSGIRVIEYLDPELIENAKKIN
jgi:hypothetical protein